MEETTKDIEKDDEILELAIHYVQNARYHPDLTKDKKRAVRKRAVTLTCEKGEVFLQVVTSAEDRSRILNACH